MDKDVVQLIKDHDLDADTTEKARDLMEDEGLDEDDATEIAPEL